MKIIFGIIIIIILVLLIVLAMNNRINGKIPIIFMFFIIITAPFIPFNEIEKFTDSSTSSLDVYYLNQEENNIKPNNNNNHVNLLEPISIVLKNEKINSVMVDIYIDNKSFDCTINKKVFKNKNKNIINLIKLNFNNINNPIYSKVNNLHELDDYLNSVEQNTYIIIAFSGIYKDKLSSIYIPENANKPNVSYLSILYKSDDYNKIYEKYNETGASYIYGFNLLKEKNIKYFDIKGTLEENEPELPIKDPNSYFFKYCLISTKDTKTKQYLVFTIDSNQSFVYLSDNTLKDDPELYDYKKTDGNEIIDKTMLYTNQPQYWNIEYVISNLGNNNVYIRTSTYPIFYLEVNDQNEIKMNMFKGGPNQYWKIENIDSDKNIFSIFHSKTEMYLNYSKNNGYLYKDNGSVYLSKNIGNWTIETNNIINQNIITDKNDWVEITSPTDFVNVDNSNGRTTWDKKYSKVWNGQYIYYGTTINEKNFLKINLNDNGNGNVIDPIVGNISVKNVGANMLYGIVKGKYLNGYKVVLEMIPLEYKYKGLKSPYPVKIRYTLIGDNNIYSFGSSDINNLNSYATKYEGGEMIYSNLLELNGINIDTELSKPKFISK